jgi:hypothetical protein
VRWGGVPTGGDGVTEKQYARPRDATADVLTAWASLISTWPLAKIRRYQRINLGHPRRTPDLEVMFRVYCRAIDMKCFPETRLARSGVSDA